MEETGLYLFAVIPEAIEQHFDSATFDDGKQQVYTVPYKDMSMVVAEVPLRIYEPNRKNAKSHQHTISHIMNHYTVIPMSFGNVLKEKQDVFIFMEQLYDQFLSIFPKIKNKIEVGLKLIAKKEWLHQQADANSSLQQLKKRDKSNYHNQLKLGEAAKLFVNSLHSQFEKEVFEPLADFADAAKSNEVINERMLLNASFLIDVNNESDFDEQVNQLYEKWNHCIDFTYTGPWPAYNFIDLKIKAGNAS